MIFASLLAKLGWETSQFKKGCKENVADLQDMEAKQKPILKRIKGSFGKNSDIGQWTKILVGGGAIGGIVLAGKKIEELADKWMGVTKAAEAAAEAQKQAADVTKSIHAGYREGEKAAAAFTKDAKKAELAIAVAGATPLGEVNIKLAARISDIEDKVSAYREKIADLKDEGEEAAKEAARHLTDIEQGKEALAETNSLDYAGHPMDAAAEALFGRQKKAIAEAQKLYDDSMNQRQLALSKATALESKLREIEISANREKNAVIAAANVEFKEVDKKRIAEAAENAKKAEKEATQNALEALEDRKEKLQAAIREGAGKEDYAVQTTHDMRHGGIVQLQPKPNDPMKTLAEKSLAELKIITQKISDLKNSDRGGSDSVAIGG